MSTAYPPTAPLRGRRVVDPAALLAAARTEHGRRHFRRAAALAATAGRCGAPAEPLALAAALAEADAWAAAGEDGRAAAAVQRILPHHPQATEAHFRLGCCLGRLERLGEAAASLQTCLDLEMAAGERDQGLRAQATCALAAIRTAAGDLAGATQLYSQTLAIGPGLTEAPYQLAACLCRLGKPRAVAARLSALLDAGDPEQGLLLADVLQTHGCWQAALQALGPVERRLGVTQETAWFRGYNLFMLRRFAAARAAFERLAPSSSLYGQALLWRLHTAWVEDDWPEATRVLRLLPKAQLPRALRRLYLLLQQLLVDGGGFTTIACRPPEAKLMGRALLTLLQAFWTVGRHDLAQRVLLFLPLLNWPEGFGEAGLLALSCGLQGRERRPLLHTAERLLAQVEQLNLAERLGQARIALELGRPHAAALALSQEEERGWEGFRLWAQALRQQAGALCRAPATYPTTKGGMGAGVLQPAAAPGSAR